MWHVFWARLAWFGQLGLIRDPLINFQNSWNRLNDKEGLENIKYTIVMYGDTFSVHHKALTPAVVKVNVISELIFESNENTHKPENSRCHVFWTRIASFGYFGVISSVEFHTRNQGPVVQSVVSLTNSLVVKMLTALVSTISNSQVFLLNKCE